MNKLEQVVYGYRTKHERGFTTKEMNKLCRELKVNEDSFHEALGVNTVMMIEGETITYHVDVLNALTKILTGDYIFWD
jgi:hypothetical protein